MVPHRLVIFKEHPVPELPILNGILIGDVLSFNGSGNGFAIGSITTAIGGILQLFSL